MPNGRKKPETRACRPQAHSGSRKAQCNGKSAQGRRWHDFQTARRQTRQRWRSARGNCEWPPSTRNHSGHAAKGRNLFPSHERKVLMATTITNFGFHAGKAAARARCGRETRALSTSEKNALLLAIADAIEAQAQTILAANRQDVESSGLEGAMRDRLLLNSCANQRDGAGCARVAALGDPIGETLAEWTRPNGLRIRKVRVPLGVVASFTSPRPNVTSIPPCSR